MTVGGRNHKPPIVDVEGGGKLSDYNYQEYVYNHVNDIESYCQKWELNYCCHTQQRRDKASQLVIKQNACKNTALWNIQTKIKLSKLQNIIKAMRKLNMHILG